MKNVYDKDFRDKLISDPNATLGADGVNYKVIKCTKDITYISIPKQNITINEMSEIHASASGTDSTASSVGTLCTTVSCIGTISSASGGY